MASRVLEAATLLLWFLLLNLPAGKGQGRLQLPLGRSSVWRAGEDVPKNYDDHMLECGGYWYKKKRGDECGLCGDPVDKTRENENGGKYANGIITASYAPGQRTQFKVLMNSNHGGFMEFKLCPETWISQGCFNKHLIQMADGSGSRFYLPKEGQGVFSVDVIIPSVTCEQCVLQWTYTGSRAWGYDHNGDECQGCGSQYQLRNCADISVTPGWASVGVPSTILIYNQAQTGGLNPEGTYWFDPSNPDTVKKPHRSGSPFSPPQGNLQSPQAMTNNPDPWTNPRTQATPAPYAPLDPWTNPRTPAINQSPSGSGIHSPYAPPQTPRSNNNPDPWTNPRTPVSNLVDPWTNPRVPSPAYGSLYPYAPPQTSQSDNIRDPWTNSRVPSPGYGSLSPYAPPQTSRSDSIPDPWISLRVPSPTYGSLSPYAPPQTSRGDANPDPWTNPRTPALSQTPSDSNLIPYAPLHNSRSNEDQDPWTRPRTPTGSQSIPKNSNNGGDPWVNPPQSSSPFAHRAQSSMRNNLSRTQAEHNPTPDPWVIPRPQQRQVPSPEDPWINSLNPENRPATDPWGLPSGIPEIKRIDIFMNKTFDASPRVNCVAVGTKAGMEGMDEWCTENCNLQYCPEIFCSCW